MLGYDLLMTVSDSGVWLPVVVLLFLKNPNIAVIVSKYVDKLLFDALVKLL